MTYFGQKFIKIISTVQSSPNGAQKTQLKEPKESLVQPQLLGVFSQVLGDLCRVYLVLVASFFSPI